MDDWKWERPVYQLVGWDRPGDRCRGQLAPCIKLAELAMPLPNRLFTLLYCLDCWQWMADHLISQGFTVDVTKEASQIMATRKQRPLRLYVRNLRAPDRVRPDSAFTGGRCDPRQSTRRAASAQGEGNCADA